jgi:hypothetical protein
MNATFKRQNDWLAGSMPAQWLAGIILVYLINAVLVAVFAEPLFSKLVGSWSMLIAGALAVSIQYIRYLLVFSGFLDKRQDRLTVIKAIAFMYMLLGVYEFHHLVLANGAFSESEYYAFVTLAIAVIFGGFGLEVFYVQKSTFETEKVQPAESTRKKRLSQNHATDAETEPDFFGIPALNLNGSGN